MLRAISAGVVLCGLVWAQGSGTAPFYTSDSIVNAASNVPGTLTPNGLATIYGKNLAWDTQAVMEEHISGGTMPLVLGGVRVYVAGFPAFLYYVSPGQVNFLIPSYIAAGECDVWVFRQGVVGPKIRVKLLDAAPALFQMDEQTAVATHADGSVVTGEDPATSGEAIVLYATGLGRTSPDAIAGQVFNPAATIRRRDALRVTLGGEVLEDWRVFYAGLQPTFAGLYQINLWLPHALGENPEIRVWIGDQASVPLRLITGER